MLNRFALHGLSEVVLHRLYDNSWLRQVEGDAACGIIRKQHAHLNQGTHPFHLFAGGRCRQVF